MSTRVSDLLDKFGKNVPLSIGSKQRTFTKQMKPGVQVSGSDTVESVSRTIGMDHSTLWKNSEKLLIEKKRERLKDEEAHIQQLVNNFIQHVPMSSYNPENLCGRLCFHGGEFDRVDGKASWLVCFSEQYQLYGCVVHGTVHRCGICQCYATRVDREAKRFCLYSNAYLGSDLDMFRHEFDVHSAYYEVVRAATYLSKTLEREAEASSSKRKMDQSEKTAQDMLVNTSGAARRVRRRVHRRRKPVRRVLGNVASTCYDVVARLFYNTSARVAIVERMLETAKKDADAALNHYLESRVVRINGRDTGVMYMCDAVVLFTILSSPFECLRNLIPAYPWPHPPCILLSAAVDRCEESTDEIENVCLMIETIWNVFQAEGCVTSSSQSLISLACYLVFSLGNSVGIVWDGDVLYPSTPFLFTNAPSTDWSIHIGTFSEGGLKLSVSNVTEGQKEYSRSMHKIQRQNPGALVNLKNNLRSIYETGDDSDGEIEGADAEKTQAPPTKEAERMASSGR